MTPPVPRTFHAIRPRPPPVVRVVPHRPPVPSPRIERLLLSLPLATLLALAWARAGPSNAPAPLATLDWPVVRDAEARALPARGRADSARVLRVCADPNNLPFSNERLEGFENRLVALLAREMHARVEYTWWAQRRGFVRNTLRAHRCDLVPGVPSSFELVLPTRPYYRSTYVFVQRRSAPWRVRSFDDSLLRRLRVGVQFIGDDGANTPPVHALSNRGIVRNVVGYSIYGDYRRPNPPARLLQAVADGEVDVAVAWGPLAGWYARQRRASLLLTPVSPQVDLPFLPFVFDIAMGVRRDDPGLRDEVDAILRRRRAAVDSILDAYGVPRVGARRSAPHPVSQR